MTRCAIRQFAFLVVALWAVGANAQLPSPKGGHCNLFPVPHKEKWGYIDGSGRLVIQPRFDEASCFKNGLARVVMGGRVGYLDLTGKVIGWWPTVEDPWELPEGLTGFQNERGLWDPGLGIRVHPYGFKDRRGNTVIEPQYWMVQGFSEGLAAVRTRSDEIWGYVDRTGRVVIPFQFADARSFREGLAAVTVRQLGVHGLHKQGVIDRTGKMVIAPQSWFIEDDFSEGLVVVETGEEWPAYTRFGYINRNGGWAIAARFYVGYRFSEGLAAVGFPPDPRSPPRTGYMGFIDRRGQTVIPPSFTAACPFQNGLAMVQIGRKVGYIDRRGAFIWGPLEEPPFSAEYEEWPCPQ